MWRENCLMGTEIDIHPVQSSILCELLFIKEGRFGQLNKLGLSTDHFSFHINQLVDWGLVDKLEKGRYCLSKKGKEFANRFDTEKTEVERQAKVAVLIVGVKKEGNVKKYLIQQRLKQPYFGFWGFLTGKIKWGETVEEAGARELMEEAGLKGKLTLTAVKHKMDYDQKSKLLEDKYFFVIRASELQGEMTEKFEGGENKWMEKKEILELTDLFDGVEESMDLVGKINFAFSESKYSVKGY
jgi:8-oxo-dGTP diphosphatase